MRRPQKPTTLFKRKVHSVKRTKPVVKAPPKPEFKPTFRSELNEALLGSVFKKPKPPAKQMGGRYGHLYGTAEEWEKIRTAVLVRDCYCCRRCRKSVRGKPRHVHHILPLSRGGRTVMLNLITLCVPCHEKMHHHMGHK